MRQPFIVLGTHSFLQVLFADSFQKVVMGTGYWNFIGQDYKSTFVFSSVVLIDLMYIYMVSVPPITASTSSLSRNAVVMI